VGVKSLARSNHKPHKKRSIWLNTTENIDKNSPNFVVCGASEQDGLESNRALWTSVETAWIDKKT